MILVEVMAAACRNYLCFDAPRTATHGQRISITYLISLQMRAYTNSKNQRILRWFMSWVTCETCGNRRMDWKPTCSGKHGRLKLSESNQAMGPKLRCPSCSSWVQGDYVLLNSFRSACGFKLHFYIHVLYSFSFKSDAAIAL